MSPRRLVLLAFVMAALAPGVARAAMPVAIYPMRVPGLSPDQRADIHSLLKAGLLSGSRRGVLRPRTPLFLAAMCTEPPSPACLARLADDGVVLVGRGERKSGSVVITAALYDRNGARTREVRFAVDLVIENLRPVNEALAQLESELDEDGTVAGAPKTPPVAEPRVPRPPAVTPMPAPSARVAVAPKPAAPAPLAVAPKPAASAPAASTPRTAWAIPLPPPPAALRGAKPTTPTATPSTPPAVRESVQAPAVATAPAKAAQAPIDVSAPAAPPVWKRQAGPFFTIVGGALVASGAGLAIANRSLAHDLDAKRAGGTLTAADRSSYDKVDRYNVLSTVLLAGGGVSVAAGTWFWITAPAKPGDPALAVAGGRF